LEFGFESRKLDIDYSEKKRIQDFLFFDINKILEVNVLSQNNPKHKI